MFGKVSLSETKQEQGILIPHLPLLKKNGIAKVYVIKTEKVVLQAITTSKTIGNKTLVSNGLNENDIIVTNGFINLLTEQIFQLKIKNYELKIFEMKENNTTKEFLHLQRIVELFKFLQNEKKEFVLSKQILRSGTSMEQTSKSLLRCF